MGVKDLIKLKSAHPSKKTLNGKNSAGSLLTTSKTQSPTEIKKVPTHVDRADIDPEEKFINELPMLPHLENASSIRNLLKIPTNS